MAEMRPIEIDATNGEFKSLSIPTTGRDISGRSTKEEALDVAYDFLNRYQEDSQDYEIVKLNNAIWEQKRIHIFGMQHLKENMESYLIIMTM